MRQATLTMVYKLWFTSYGLQAMVCKLGQNTENKWRRPGGYTPVVKVFNGTRYIDGEESAGRDRSSHDSCVKAVFCRASDQGDTVVRGILSGN